MAALTSASWWRRHLPLLSSLLAILGVIVVVLSQLHVNLLLSNTTTTGGDTGAHVALPLFLKETLLPHGQLTGWYPGWYNGFPLYTYYFVLPDLFAALLSYLIPYGIAFKMATILGSVLMPVCAYLMGRLFRLKAPLPAALAVVTLPFLFDSTFTIDGGNLFSTLAGEYAFSLSLALSFLVIGLFARGVSEGKGSIITPIVMALCLASHLVPFLFAGVGAGLVTLWSVLPWRLRGDGAQGSSIGLLGDRELSRKAAALWALRTGAIGLALSGWWLVPFLLGQKYTNPMGYVNDTDYMAKLFPRADMWVVALAVVGVVLAIRQMSRFGVVFALQAVIWGVVFVVDPQGSLWNERILPLFYVSLYILAGWTVGYLVAATARWYRRQRLEHYERSIADGTAHGGRPTPPSWLPGAVAGPIVLLALSCAVVLPPLLPGLISPTALSKIGITVGANQVSSWSAWNYSGYEGKPAYPEYKALMTKMASLGATYGCGRAMWEYNPSLNRFGTPMALMLLPYWTNNCIGSQEGLFFESSPTVPYHFLIQSEISQSPSDPQVGLPYSGLNVAQGVAHLQMLGVKYLMTSTPAVSTIADSLPSLTKVASVGPYSGESSGVSTTTWSIYLIHNSAPVVGLTHLPVVVPGIAATVDSWKNANVAWFETPSRWSVPLAASGPANWPRGTASTKTSPAVTPATVTNIVQGTSSISFHVDRIGVPVAVKTSYFPRWKVSGATGPYRISPDLMAVVPTSHDVTLTYGADPSVTGGEILTALAVLSLLTLGVIARRTKQRKRARHAA